MAIAGGSTSDVASTAINTVNRAIAQVSRSSWVMASETAPLEHLARGRAFQEFEKLLRLGFARADDDRRGIRRCRDTDVPSATRAR